MASVILACLTGQIRAQEDNELRFITDFPGGNIIIEKISNDTVYVKPDLRDTEGDWFYWYFGVKGAAGRKLTFQFADVRKMAAFGPAVSTDKGKSWSWLYREHGVRSAFSYEFKPGEEEIRFSVGIPYLQEDLNAFLERHSGNLYLRKDTLCTTPKGRPVEQLVIRSPNHVPRYKVLITARHHACEAMVSYELEGIMEALLTDAENMQWLRENVEFMIIPFIDIDGVQDGDQGKNRNGRDHNRDYGEKSRYVATAAIQRKIPEWAGNKLRMVFDLHCPYINATTAPRNETIFITGSGNEEIAARQKKWMNILEESRKGELTFIASKSYMEYGTGWNRDSGSTEGQRYTFTRWIRKVLPGVPMSTTIEFPYATTNGQMITPGNARAFGRDVARSISLYLQH